MGEGFRGVAQWNILDELRKDEGFGTLLESRALIGHWKTACDVRGLGIGSAVRKKPWADHLKAVYCWSFLKISALNAWPAPYAPVKGWTNCHPLWLKEFP